MVKDKWTLADAQAFADQYEINLQVNYQQTGEVAEGIVLSQSRAANSKIVKGVTLTIEVSKAVDTTGGDSPTDSTTTPDGLSE
jgi:beta-lactam-binding protein with PASTA domain